MNDQQKKIVNEKWFSVPEAMLHDKEIIIPIQLDTSLGFNYRSAFDRDRDRILFSKAFRRLNGKTQIFIPRSHDYVRTRLTHSLEVNQIAKSIGKGLGLNLSLIESIALGHDVGHTPFGHAGEYELNRIMNNCLYHSYSSFPMLSKEECGFKHNLQSIRVLSELESNYGEKGLGLTPFSLWGIANHTSVEPKTCEYINKTVCPRQREFAICPSKEEFSVDFYSQLINQNTTINNYPAWSFEGIIVNISDEIAQIHHDIEDSLYMNILTITEAKDYVAGFVTQLMNSEDFVGSKSNYELILNSILASIDQRLFLDFTRKIILDLLISQLIRKSLINLERLSAERNITSRSDFSSEFIEIGISKIFSESGNKVTQELIPFDKEAIIKDFQSKFYNRVINSSEVQKLDNLGYKIIQELFQAFYSNPRILNDKTLLFFVDVSSDAKEVMKQSGFYRIRKDEGQFRSRQKEGLGEIRNQMSGMINNFDDENHPESNSNAVVMMRLISDHISGMTDAYALSMHREIFGSNFGI